MHTSGYISAVLAAEIHHTNSPAELWGGGTGFTEVALLEFWSKPTPGQYPWTLPSHSHHKGVHIKEQSFYFGLSASIPESLILTTDKTI